MLEMRGAWTYSQGRPAVGAPLFAAEVSWGAGRLRGSPPRRDGLGEVEPG
jgi:hypothetical protein